MTQIIKRRKLYCYSQSLRLNNSNDQNLRNINSNNHKLRYVISDHPLKKENWYKAATDAGLNYWEWRENNWYPLLNIDKMCEIEELTLGAGWNGLYQLLPYINPGNYVEFIISVEFNSEDCRYYEEDEEELEDIDNPDFICSHDFYVLNRYDNIMLGWGDDIPEFDLEDGYVKWDVIDRNNATLAYKIIDLFGDNNYGSHSQPEPYKARITIKGNIYTE